MVQGRNKKCRITLTDSINSKLDEAEPTTTDAYVPTKSRGTQDFVNLVGKDNYFSDYNDIDTVNKLKTKPKTKKKEKRITSWLDYIIMLFTLVGFVAFILIVTQYIN